MVIGLRIMYLRKKAHMSQAELGRRLNISASAVGMYEQGRRTPGIDIIIRLAEIFSVSTDTILLGWE